MIINNVEKFLLCVLFSIIMFCSASSMVLTKTQYKQTSAFVNSVDNLHDSKTNTYLSSMVLMYEVNDIPIFQKLKIEVKKPYQVGDMIEIQYNLNNYNEITLATKNSHSTISSLSAVLFLLIAVYTAADIKENLIDKINDYLNVFHLM